MAQRVPRRTLATSEHGGLTTRTRSPRKKRHNGHRTPTAVENVNMDRPQNRKPLPRAKKPRQDHTPSSQNKPAHLMIN
jgi:hypothetical protein